MYLFKHNYSPLYTRTYLYKPTHTSTNTHIHLYKQTFTFVHGMMVECSPIARETWVQFQVESYQKLKKWYLIPPCLILSTRRCGSRVTLSNPEKGVAPSPTPWCSSYRKGSFRVTLDYGRQFYFFNFTYAYTYIIDSHTCAQTLT